MNSEQRNILHNFIYNHFNLEEFKTLCFSISIQYDDLGGEGLNSKVRELVLFVERRGSTSELLSALKDHPMAWNLGLMSNLAAIPTVPEPYFAHPYPIQRNFTGREAEKKELTKWLNDDEHPIYVIQALGGMGKSALSWWWVQNDVLHQSIEGILWWSFYEGEISFSSFLDEAIQYLEPFGANFPQILLSDYENVRKLLRLLQSRKILIILDGFERQLRAFSTIDIHNQEDFENDMNIRACVDPNVSLFLRHIVSRTTRSKILITTRLMPRDIEDRVGMPLDGCIKKELRSLESKDAIHFMESQGIIGTKAEIGFACETYGYHPLSLRLLSGYLLRRLHNPGDINNFPHHNLNEDLIEQQHHILETSYNALNGRLRKLLSQIAVFRSTIKYTDLKILCTFNGYQTEEKFENDLDDLITRGLLFHDRTHNLYDLHPIVREYAYKKLDNKAEIHERFVSHFEKLEIPESIFNIENLGPWIEFYYHLVGAGIFDKVVDLIHDRLRPWIYYKLGMYHLFAELLQVLVSENPIDVPGLTSQHEKAYILNMLANSLCFCGRPKAAIPYFKKAIEMDTENGINYPVNVGNIAVRCYFPLGDIDEAQKGVESRITVSKQMYEKLKGSKDKYKEANFCRLNEAIGHSDLGYILSAQGKWEKSENEFSIALRMFKERQSKGIVRRLRSQSRLIRGDLKRAYEDAKLALEYATEYNLSKDIVYAKYALGTTILVKTKTYSRNKIGEKRIAEAESLLLDALKLCRKCNLIEAEPEILNSLSILYCLKGEKKIASRYIGDALNIAKRCGYLLIQKRIENTISSCNVLV